MTLHVYAVMIRKSRKTPLINAEVMKKPNGDLCVYGRRKRAQTVVDNMNSVVTSRFFEVKKFPREMFDECW